MLSHNTVFVDPSPMNLITTFYNAMQEFIKNRSKPSTIDVENGEYTNPQDCLTDGHVKFKLKRNLALKVLSLKVAAYIKWNLSKISSCNCTENIILVDFQTNLNHCRSRYKQDFWKTCYISQTKTSPLRFQMCSTVI